MQVIVAAVVSTIVVIESMAQSESVSQAQGVVSVVPVVGVVSVVASVAETSAQGNTGTVAETKRASVDRCLVAGVSVSTVASVLHRCYSSVGVRCWYDTVSVCRGHQWCSYAVSVTWITQKIIHFSWRTKKFPAEKSLFVPEKISHV